jgi:hypothetical protein
MGQKLGMKFEFVFDCHRNDSKLEVFLYDII